MCRIEKKNVDQEDLKINPIDIQKRNKERHGKEKNINATKILNDTNIAHIFDGINHKKNLIKIIILLYHEKDGNGHLNKYKKIKKKESFNRNKHYIYFQ